MSGRAAVSTDVLVRAVAMFASAAPIVTDTEGVTVFVFPAMVASGFGKEIGGFGGAMVSRVLGVEAYEAFVILLIDPV